MPNMIVHVEIPFVDLKRAMDFYRKVLGVELGDVEEIHGNKMAFFPIQDGEEGASVALAQGEAYVPTLNGAIVYLTTDSIDGVIAKAKKHGSEILFPKTSIGEKGFVAEIKDSEGNRIALQSAR